MDKITSKVKQSLKRCFKKLFHRTPNNSEPSTAPSTGQGTNAPDITATSSQPASEQIFLSRPLSVIPAPHPEPEDVTQSPAVSVALAAPTKPVTAHYDWLGLKAFASVVSKLSEPFGPLKRAVGDILNVVESFELAAQNREDLQKLEVELNELLHDLARLFGCVTPPTMTSSMANLARGIEEELLSIRRKQDRSGAKDYFSAETDADQILEHYRNLKGLFRRLMLNANLEIWKAINEQAINDRVKGLPSSPAAKYHSAKSVILRGGCTPETRVGLLRGLYEWACDSKSQRIYWLNGMAGTGKTTIAYSFCQKLEESSRLAASFFCSRQLQGCHDVDQIVPTISYQLSQFSLPFRAAVSRVLENDPDVHNRSVKEQFRRLIVEPLILSKAALPTDLVVVVDALDECEGNRGADMFMTLLSYAQDLPVKFFVASRPEARILDLMRVQTGDQIPKELRLHELDRFIITEDIRTYLRVRIASGMEHLSELDLDTLVERSGTLFIYAATVVRYIESDNFSRAAKRLKEVLESGKSGSRSDSDKDINALYTTILTAAFEDPSLTESDRAETKQILYTVVCAQEPLSIDIIAGLLGLERETVRAALRPLLSVLQVSDTTETVTTLHESFPDYLLAKNRSGEFYCDAKEHNACLTRCCFDQINIPDPPFNICRLESSYVLDTEVPDLPIRVEKAISRELRYACRYWGTHTMLAGESEDVARMLAGFFSERLLLWLEVMNLCDYIKDGVTVLDRMQNWASSIGWLDDNIKRLVHDAWMFAASFSWSPAKLSTPHIYISALTFCPVHNLMREIYQQDSSKLITSASTAMNLWSAIPLSIQETRSRITSISYSPDGAYIASGSEDKTVRIWDTYTGQPAGQPLEGHTSGVASVAFSSDGMRVVSGSWDNSIRTWDARTGQPVGQPLEGHTRAVASVAYSPDSAYIVSGSYDHTVRIWDARAYLPAGQPLEGHSSHVASVAYSPDGAYVISGSWDNTIHIWDADTRQLVGQIPQAHTSFVRSVSYSPDGAYIVSGSSDCTIRIWDARTRQPVGQPLEGHTGDVFTVAYSPDGAYIVSGSSDKTIRIWDALNSQPIGQPLEGHSSYITSVAYSPDGTYITSASLDQTARIWNPQLVIPKGFVRESHSRTSQIAQPFHVTPEVKSTEQRVLCNLGCRIDCPHIAWTLREDGWIVHGDNKLIWVPPDLRKTLVLPQNTVVIYKRGFLRLDIKCNMFGDHWFEYFRPGKSTRPWLT